MIHAKFTSRAGVAALALVACAAAQAVPVTFTGFANGSQSIRFDLSPSSSYDNVTIRAGGFTTHYDSRSFVSYCVDLFELLPAFNTSNNSYAEVGASAYFGAKTDDVARLFSGVSGQVDSALEEAAFQLALWEIKYETTPGAYNLGTGTAKFLDMKSSDGNAVAVAQTWLNGLGSYDNHVQLHVLQSLGRPGKQDVVFATPVPEPATWLLMVGGLAAFGALARRGISRST